jgi:signal transduction histidine kinase
MRKIPTLSVQAAMAIFVILVVLFVAQMNWWIIFQIRNSENTKTFMTETYAGEQRRLISLLNEHYRAVYEAAQMAVQSSPEGALSHLRIADEAVSGLVREADLMGKSFADSLYFRLTGGKVAYLLFLNRDYPGRYLGTESPLIYRPGLKGELTRPDWVTPEIIAPNPAKFAEIDRQEHKHLRMFLMEGSFFILLIIIGTYLVYLSLRRTRQIRQEQLLFVHSITHELKVPITSIGLFIDALRRRQYEPALTAELVPKMKDDLTRLNHLIDNVLQVRKLSEKQIEFRRDPIDLSAELKRFTAPLASKIEAAGGKLHTKIEDGIRIQGDMEILLKVWESLVDNAMKYAGSGTLELTISLQSHKDNAVLEIIDNGSGIPEGMEEKLFEPFFRGDIESKKSIPGSGLGLYLAREFIRRSGGQITLSNAAGGGCLVRLTYAKIR